LHKGIYYRKRLSILHQENNFTDAQPENETLLTSRPQSNSNDNFVTATAKTGGMGYLELDHYGYLLGKIVELFRQGEEPHTEVTILWNPLISAHSISL
jgi:hypothetical protein